MKLNERRVFVRLNAFPSCKEGRLINNETEVYTFFSLKLIDADTVSQLTIQ